MPMPPETMRATIGRLKACRDTEFKGAEARYATRRTVFSVSMVRPTSDAGHGLPK